MTTPTKTRKLGKTQQLIMNALMAGGEVSFFGNNRSGPLKDSTGKTVCRVRWVAVHSLLDLKLIRYNNDPVNRFAQDIFVSNLPR